MAEVIAATGAELGLLTVPSEMAQSVADSLAAAGIRGLLNFAPVVLRLPPGVRFVSVDLAIQLLHELDKAGVVESRLVLDHLHIKSAIKVSYLHRIRLTFVRNQQDRVTALAVGGGRVTAIRFERKQTP